MDPTRTDVRDLTDEVGPYLVPTLFVAHDRRSAFVGDRLLLSGPLVLGREGIAWPEVLDDTLISREHCRIFRRKGELYVQDLESRNGTSVNGNRLGQSEHRLKIGDVIGVGELMLVVGQTTPREAPMADCDLVGVSRGLAMVVESVASVAPHASTVLVLGEPGVGKELIARQVHKWSGRTGRLITVDCGALGDGVMKSELFGHRKGAFTGADTERIGLVEAAHEGTLFLDEIGNAPAGLQTALLRLLQEGEIRRLGDNHSRRVDVRFICATNADLDAMVGDGEFRLDLLTRLRRWVIDVPPLCQRREDICVLAMHLAARYAGRPIVLSGPLSLALLLHDWPGNIRELDAIIERAVISARGASSLALTAALQADLSKARGGAASGPKGGADANRMVRPSRQALVERMFDCNFQMSSLARELGIGRSTLYRWIAEMDIDVATLRERGP